MEDECRKTFNTASKEKKARKELADIFFDKNKLQGKIMDQALKGSPVQVAINDIEYTILMRGPDFCAKLSFFKAGPIDSPSQGNRICTLFLETSRLRSIRLCKRCITDQ